MRFPARSPDLNTVEDTCSIMALRVYANAKQYDTRMELQQAILDAWGSITLDEVRALIGSMRRRCVETNKKKGDKTDY